MPGVVLVGLLVAGVIVLTPLADRVRIPQPILLLLYGLVLATLPGLPELSVNANLILPLVLPPLLFAATLRTTVGQFRASAGTVLLLAVGLTVATAVVVAVAAHLGGLPWAAAAVLGAIVSPPDPVAATAVARRVRLPERLVTILEGEGMFNDATALVMYKVAVAAAVTGTFSVADAGVELILAIVVGTGVGLLAGWLTWRGLAALDDASAETTLTIAAPFLAYLAAEELRGSGVLAVLALGLFLRTVGEGALTPRGWLVGRTVWEYADFIISSLVFAFVGFELTTVIRDTSTGPDTLRLAALVLAVVVLFRPIWIFPASALARLHARRRDRSLPYCWQETAVVSWAGMRGVVTVATALALPTRANDGTPLGWRATVVFIALACVFVTLLVQGLTLTPLIHLLHVGTETDEQAQAARLRRRAVQSALDALRSEASRCRRPGLPGGDHAVRGSTPQLRPHPTGPPGSSGRRRLPPGIGGQTGRSSRRRRGCRAGGGGAGGTTPPILGSRHRGRTAGGPGGAREG